MLRRLPNPIYLSAVLVSCATLPLTAGCIQVVGQSFSAGTTAVEENEGNTEPQSEAVPRPKVETAQQQALAKLKARLQAISSEVNSSAERRVEGVNVAAHLHRTGESGVSAVVMNVNVYWCSDGCIDGPAETPAKDADLKLLLPFAKTLTVLDLQHTEITDSGLVTVGKLTELESLNLAGTGIKGSGLPHLIGLTKLEHLDLSDSEVTPEELLALSKFPSLRTVLLPPAAVTDDVLAAIGKLSRLEQLSLVSAAISDKGLKHLSELKSLERLDLSKTKISNVGLKHLKGLTSLKEIKLANTSITGAGLASLSGLTKLEQLDLSFTLVDDAGLSQLSELAELRELHLQETEVEGFGFAYLKGCRKLEEAFLPPIQISAVVAINEIKSWHRLFLMVKASEDLSTAVDVTFGDMPNLRNFTLRSETPIGDFNLSNCPHLESLHVAHPEEILPGAHLRLEKLPALWSLRMSGAFQNFTGKATLSTISQIYFEGILSAAGVQSISRCPSLTGLYVTFNDVIGKPIAFEELSELPNVKRLTLHLGSANAAWVVRLAGKMRGLTHLDIRGEKLTGTELDHLAGCKELTEIYVHGIDDMGEPLRCLQSLPKVRQFLAIGCPRIGLIRLNERTGLEKFYFRFGQLDELEINGPPNLTDVYLGTRIFGYNDEDERLPSLELGKLSVSNAPELLYLEADARKAEIPFTQITLTECPKVRCLKLLAPPKTNMLEKCPLTANGNFLQLAESHLQNLVVDKASLAKLTASPTLQKSQSEGVDVIDLEEPQPTDR